MMHSLTLGRCRALALGAVIGLCAGTTAQAQQRPDDAQEAASRVSAPPYDASRALSFDASKDYSLRFAVDPATVTREPDGELRYVVIARGSGGAQTALYDGMRCISGQYTTYARASANGGWSSVTKPEWRSVFDDKAPALYPKYLTYFMCNEDGTPALAREAAYYLRSGTNPTRLQGNR